MRSVANFGPISERLSIAVLVFSGFTLLKNGARLSELLREKINALGALPYPPLDSNKTKKKHKIGN